MADEEIKEEEIPIAVTIKEKDKKATPNFDYDDYTPSEEEIIQTESEIEEIVKKRTTDGS